MNNTRFDYSPIIDRKPFKLPNNARVALWVIPNIEHFHIDRPSTSIVPVTVGLVPDILNYSWRDYGVRVGIWRLMEIMEKYGVRGTVALNSEVCEHYPRIIEEGNKLGWEWMGHGQTNSRFMANMTEEEERIVIKDVISTIERSTGVRPKGWLSPALTETFNTPDLLAEEGIEYVANWVNDEQPYPLKVRKNSLISVPYSIEINDIPAFLDLGRTGEEFYQMMVDTFDVLYEEGGNSPRVMAISLHPFLISHPHRSKYLEKALNHITSHKDVWITTGAEISDHYKRNYLTMESLIKS
ncbi:polysaccharide deacetylase [Bacillus sp. M6-12]|uniref:polysaccharide deacetylase family protein n=1 Tax=Bacillus sp. M6-12 TaxID=2054166 RepID=UPI000C75EC7F|nr:polysaccharide deacetylase family protein [Bacillus sp. M6-12]PLS16783.1 polysaccharide deacetylase [Bacillus sp. M6-12]